MRTVRFTQMRSELAVALGALADLEYQHRAWIQRLPERAGRHSDLSLVVHILYDDTQVLPDPAVTTGNILFEEEIASFERLEAVFGPLLDRLGDAPDSEFVESSEWGEIAGAAGLALAAMARNGGFSV